MSAQPTNVPEPRLENLYQEVILDHNRNPRNFKEIREPKFYSHGHNPLCGDDYHIYINVDDDNQINDIGFHGNGCAISKASASLMTSLIKGKKVQDALNLKDNVIQLMTKDDLSQSVRENSGRMIIFEGVKEFPVRVKCATLAWQALGAALKDAEKGA